ncbi:Riboflavin transporter FmnP [Atopostipes suicloacalis DSM 15692]|uniref:Riboflavin transporter n=1 Tax=Atopostipes suicloacalis DSM 15692 TaxID=1121025 RepID=A0A1M4TBW1_9LACT|nr:ECF transporter S component [Atopostipes suicloacalis]SHE41940.1 Riboflavin transporter FmnP [Atopostipes suicloacalis DSM 15692]
MIEQRTKKVTMIGILAAVAWVISQFSFPILYWAPFLKIDFSDIPILLGMYVFGPLSGVAIAAIRSLLSYITSGGEAGFPIGDTTAFIGTLSLTLPIYYAIKNKGSNKKKSILAGSIATVSLTITMTILNWLVVAPLYMKVMGFSVGPMREYLTLSVIPFNLVKGILVSLIFFIVFYQIQGYLNKLKNKNNPIDLNISEIK